MRDEMNRNPLTVTGTPSLVTGALTVDLDQGLAFNGTTNSAAANDSTSLSITGSMSIECFVRLAAYPGTLQNIVVKGGSYAIQIDTTGHIGLVVVGTASSATLFSNVALSLNTWYHVVCVYNGNYAGAQTFGNSTSTSLLQVDDDAQNNKAVGKFTLLEAAVINNVVVWLQYADEIWPVQMRAVVYADSAGSPGALVTTSDMLTLNTPMPQWRVLTPVTFSLTPQLLPAGSYHIGFVADTVAGPLNKAVLQVGRIATGGTTSKRPDAVSGPSDPFGTILSSTADTLATTCDYTAIGRSGFEGKVLIYINGARNTSATYSGGIADTANTLQVCPTLAAQVDEISVWDKALTSVQIATHYTAH